MDRQLVVRAVRTLFFMAALAALILPGLPGCSRKPAPKRYDLEVRSNGARCYQGDQSAAWMLGTEGLP